MDPLTILPFILVGFAAQLVDGALGMAFGVISSTLLISLGVPPAAASAGVHFVEIFTTGASGLSHIYQRNVDWRLFLRLMVPALIGGIAGATLISGLSATIARPAILLYLLAIALSLLWRGWRGAPRPRAPRIVMPLALAGGFLDAAGGGGYGPVVTSNLLVQGAPPRSVIGSVNLSEFFLTLIVSATFIGTLGRSALSEATLGLLVGGLLAAPLGALIAKRVPAQRLLLLVGMILALTSAWGIYTALSGRG
ncbi:sulfite exporter TauE/SafE family protein [Sphingomonas morindae]|uniref:Probable membrane transporter protein n=1 Tax=Sphingomonas morindae TaxID=1541170 RepID=A0ABY4XBB0_9SPHN|nr:sulfite exporter TauE/SafE family protein [Sphingomonas morindae]USI74133.1 sulfite exporter TauE/SafE family protein [Sphingomonas morindae]